MSKPDNVVCDGDVCYVVKGSASHKADAKDAGSALSQLLGDSLLGGSGQGVPTASVTGPSKVVGLYFSAHWCPPCRAFTPQLAAIYKQFKESHARKDDFNIVFVSSDRDEASFNSYFGEMPWLALPFEKRELKARLSSKFKVQGIPTFILLDGATGSVINSNGREAILSDPEGKDFPWKPQSFGDVISGAELVNKEGQVFKAEDALAGKVKLLYFSAHWCGPCRRFTPELVACYQKLTAAGKNVEVVFVSGDRNEAGFQEYLNEMPWLALAFADGTRKEKLNSIFEVEGIPTLIVLDENDKVITTRGRSVVAADPEGADFPWHPKPLDLLSENIDLVNGGPTLIMYVDSADKDAAKARAQAVLGSLATSAKAASAAMQQDDVNFLWGTLGEELMVRVLEFAKVDAKEGGGDGLLLLDVPSQCLYRFEVSPPTADTAATFFSGYLAGSLTKVELGN